MSRRKHAWDAYRSTENSDATYETQRAIEVAAIEDFMDDVHGSIGRIDCLLDEAPNNSIKLGLLLVQNILRETLDNWCSE